MLIEIISVNCQAGIVHITALDVSEENLQRIERVRDDFNNVEINFVFDTHNRTSLQYLYSWLKRQKSVKTNNCSTWGEALRSVEGTISTISAKYRSWE